MGKCYRLIFILLSLCLFNTGLAHELISPGQPKTAEAGAPYVPWLAGPLLAPYETAVSVGHFFIEPYFNLNMYTGVYDSKWDEVKTPTLFSFAPQLQTYIGLTKSIDINISPQMIVNSFEDQNYTSFADLPVAIDMQIIPVDITKWYPSLKVAILETFPTGNYRDLDPKKSGIDATGSGAYSTNFNFVMYKVINVWAHHFMSMYLSWGYTISSPIKVRGFNSYGGGYNTKGKIKIGDSWQGLFSFEFTLTQRWVLALDTLYTHTDRSKFSGYAGVGPDGKEALNGEHSSERLAFAPAIEYNINAKYGFIGGCYFSALGRNTTVFRNASIAFAAYF
jgi:hypothetical protein